MIEYLDFEGRACATVRGPPAACRCKLMAAAPTGARHVCSTALGRCAAGLGAPGLSLAQPRLAIQSSVAVNNVCNNPISAEPGRNPHCPAAGQPHKVSELFTPRRRCEPSHPRQVRLVCSRSCTTALEKAGVEFIPEDDLKGPGVRLKESTRSKPRRKRKSSG